MRRILVVLALSLATGAASAARRPPVDPVDIDQPAVPDPEWVDPRPGYYETFGCKIRWVASPPERHAP